MKTILIVDDEQDIVELVRYNLQKEGFSVLTANTGKQALVQAQTQPNLLLLDVMMPELDGIETLKQLRSNTKTKSIPVIFLTAKGSEVDEVLGLELGADDYIIKPISIPKLIARIKNVLRKHEVRMPASEDEAIKAGEIEIILSKHVITIEGKEIFFPKKEYEVLLYLTKHADRVVQRESLLEAVWGTDVIVGDRTIDVHIRKIREKLGKHSGYIETIKGVGYKLRISE